MSEDLASLGLPNVQADTARVNLWAHLFAPNINPDVRASRAEQLLALNATFHGKRVRRKLEPNGTKGTVAHFRPLSDAYRTSNIPLTIPYEAYVKLGRNRGVYIPVDLIELDPPER